MVAAYAAPTLLFPDVPWAFPVMIYLCINRENLAARICIYKTLPHLMKKSPNGLVINSGEFHRSSTPEICISR